MKYKHRKYHRTDYALLAFDERDFPLSVVCEEAHERGWKILQLVQEGCHREVQVGRGRRV